MNNRLRQVLVVLLLIFAVIALVLAVQNFNQTTGNAAQNAYQAISTPVE